MLNLAGVYLGLLVLDTQNIGEEGVNQLGVVLDNLGQASAFRGESKKLVLIFRNQAAFLQRFETDRAAAAGNAQPLGNICDACIPMFSEQLVHCCEVVGVAVCQRICFEFFPDFVFQRELLYGGSKTILYSVAQTRTCKAIKSRYNPQLLTLQFTEAQMPRYDYRCTDCGHEFEATQSMKDDPLSICPECDGALKRLIGAGAGIIFKGSGFYCTDYRSDSYQKDAKKDSESKPSQKAEKKKPTAKKPAASAE